MAFNPNPLNMAGLGGQRYELPWNTQQPFPRKPAGDLSPRSAAKQGGVSLLMPQQLQQTQQKAAKKGFPFDDNDDEPAMYFNPGSVFGSGADKMLGATSPSQLSLYAQQQGLVGGLQQRGFGGNQFQRNLTPTSMSGLTGSTAFTQQQQQQSPNRSVIGPGPLGQRNFPQGQIGQAGPISIQKRLNPVTSGIFSSANTSSVVSGFSGFPPRPDALQPNFDPAEFPSLGNRGPIAPPTAAVPQRNYVGMVNKPTQDATPEFTIQQEDFPALPGATNASNANASEVARAIMSGLQGVNSYEQALAKDGGSMRFAVEKGAPSKKGIQTHADGTVSNIPVGMVNDQFGMVGLLTFIRAAETDPNLVALAPGIDLTTLGLNLNSPDNLYSTFQSPWSDAPCRPQDIDFHVPSEYLTNIFIRDKLAPIKLNRYGEDLLFFLFYMYGGDVLQLVAAAELYNRDWRYHKEERVWITRAPGVEPQMKTNSYERGTYYFFDPQNWRKVPKEFHLEYDKLEERPHLPSTIHQNANQAVMTHA